MSNTRDLMERILTKIGDMISTEIEEISDIKYLDPEMGFVCVLTTHDGEEIILSLI